MPSLLACAQRAINRPTREVLTFPSQSSCSFLLLSVVQDSRLVLRGWGHQSRSSVHLCSRWLQEVLVPSRSSLNTC